MFRTSFRVQLFIFVALFPPCSVLLSLGLLGDAVVSQDPSSLDPLEVSSMPFCLGTCGAGSARTGGESRAEFSPVFIRVQTLLAEQSPASPRTVLAADAWSLLAVRHLRGKHVHPIPTQCSCRSCSQYLPACPVRGRRFEGLKVEGRSMSRGGGSWVSHFQIIFPAVSLTGHPSIWPSSWSHMGLSAWPFALLPYGHGPTAIIVSWRQEI